MANTWVSFAQFEDAQWGLEHLQCRGQGFQGGSKIISKGPLPTANVGDQ